MTGTVGLSVAAVLAAVVTPAIAADLTPTQKDGVCLVSLASVNGNAKSDYRRKGKDRDIIEFTSAKGYAYFCEVFSEGKVLTLSSDGWGRLKPTGHITTEGNCSTIKLFDPGFGSTKSLQSCSK